jgi:hypothetical protein
MVLLSFLVFFSFHCALILPPLEEVGTKVVDGWQYSEMDCKIYSLEMKGVTLCVQANIPILAPQKSVVTPVPQERAKLHLARMGPGRSNNQRRMSKAWIRRQRGTARLGSCIPSQDSKENKTDDADGDISVAAQDADCLHSVRRSLPLSSVSPCTSKSKVQCSHNFFSGRSGSIPI